MTNAATNLQFALAGLIAEAQLNALLAGAAPREYALVHIATGTRLTRSTDEPALRARAEELNIQANRTVYTVR